MGALVWVLLIASSGAPLRQVPLGAFSPAAGWSCRYGTTKSADTRDVECARGDTAVALTVTARAFGDGGGVVSLLERAADGKTYAVARLSLGLAQGAP